MELRVDGQVAIVTGAAQNIGRAIARVLAESGARVLLTDIQDERGEATATALRAAGGEVSYARADVSQEDDIRRMVETAVARYGRLDILVNNAHWEAHGTVEEVSLADWDRSLRVLLTAAYLGTKYAAPHLRRAGRGSIINISSVHAFRVSRAYPTYQTAKAGLIHLTRQIAFDYGPDGIRCNAICPGAIPPDDVRAEKITDPTWTGRHYLHNRLRRVGNTADIANAVLFLCSEAAGFITGHALVVDGGFILPFASESMRQLADEIRQRPAALDEW
ncbi:MAG: SDR family oxidoreductase [Chloroflexi bacterium]|nr:SDR family oxidoreductase [Chloroflexota bacterium]